MTFNSTGYIVLFVFPPLQMHAVIDIDLVGRAIVAAPIFKYTFASMCYSYHSQFCNRARAHADRERITLAEPALVDLGSSLAPFFTDLEQLPLLPVETCPRSPAPARSRYRCVPACAHSQVNPYCSSVVYVSLFVTALLQNLRAH